MHLGEITGWTSVALGQLVSWPQVLKLRRERGDGVSLASYAIVIVSMSLFLVHAIAIGDLVSTVSVPVSLIPNVLVVATLMRRRPTPTAPAELFQRALGEEPADLLVPGFREPESSILAEGDAVQLRSADGERLDRAGGGHIPVAGMNTTDASAVEAARIRDRLIWGAPRSLGTR